MKIIIIIPTYNEAENIGRMLDILVTREIAKISGHKIEILVVDSKSPDGTEDIVRQRMKKYRNVYLLSTNRGGLGADYVKGMKYAMQEMKADAVMEMDSDFQHDPADVKRLIAAADRGADHVIGSRYIPGGAIPKEWSFHRKAMSFFGSLFARLVLFLFGVHDMTSGFKLTKTNYLRRVNLDNLYSNYYAYKIQITYELAKLGAGIVEVPIVFHERKEGSSKISRKDLIDSFLVVVRLRLRDSKRFIKFGIVGFFGYVINALGLEIFSAGGLNIASFSLSCDICAKFTEGLAGKFIAWRGQWPLSIASEPSAWAAAFAAEIAIASNYTFNNFWTFAKRQITAPLRFLWKFSHFNITSIGAVIIQFLVVGAAVILFGDTHLVRQVALICAVIFLIVPYNYTMYNVFIWKTWKVPGLRWLQNRRPN